MDDGVRPNASETQHGTNPFEIDVFLDELLSRPGSYSSITKVLVGGSTQISIFLNTIGGVWSENLDPP